MTRHTRSLLIAAGGGGLVAAFLLLVLRGSHDGHPVSDPPAPPPQSGIQRALGRLRNTGTAPGRVHRPDRNVPEIEEIEANEFDELWQLLEDEQTEDMVKESAALKLAARGGAEAISRLWDMWQSGKLPASCSWIVDMANNGTGLDPGEDAMQPRRPTVSPERVAEAVVHLMNAELNDDERLQAIRLLRRAGTEKALAALEVIADGAHTATPDVRQAAFEALADNDTGRAAGLLAARLERESLDPEMLVEYLEALEEDVSVSVTRLALSLLTHEDSEVRDQAAWLIALNIDEQPELAVDVISALNTEGSPAVRSRLYDALGGETAAEAQMVLRLTQQEAHAAVQIAGYKALGRMAAADQDGAAAQLFNAQVIPLLTDTALHAPDYQIRFGAFIALRLARTEEATQAIRKLAAEAGDRRIAEAAAAATR